MLQAGKRLREGDVINGVHRSPVFENPETEPGNVTKWNHVARWAIDVPGLDL